MAQAQETMVLVIGAGPAGISTSACLNLLSIPNIVLEREKCCASLWKMRAYDRLKLHLPKQFCELPHMPYPKNTPTFVPKNEFISYLDNYVSHFNVAPLYDSSVESAFFDEKWHVMAKNACSGEVEKYTGEFLVVATGENNEGFIPKFDGLDGFKGEVLHSNQYVNGKAFEGKDVLVVGSGNSGMEIAYDLSNWGVKTSIVVRSPAHVLTKEEVQLGMTLLKYMSCNAVDKIIVTLSKIIHGDLSQYGFQRPTEGPFFLKKTTGQSPIIDVGCIEKVKDGEIEVFPSLASFEGESVRFTNGKAKKFDAVVFATGYRSAICKWLKDDGDLFNKDGMPKHEVPNHWKGKNGIYCAGFARSALFGIANDARNIANDIHMILGVGMAGELCASKYVLHHAIDDVAVLDGH